VDIADEDSAVADLVRAVLGPRTYVERMPVEADGLFYLLRYEDQVALLHRGPHGAHFDRVYSHRMRWANQSAQYTLDYDDWPVEATGTASVERPSVTGRHTTRRSVPLRTTRRCR
jgi:hypothetical protein